VLGTAYALPFPKDYFDTIWTCEVFEHCPNIEAAMREAMRVLSPEGVLVIVDKHPGRGKSGPEWEAYWDYGSIAASLALEIVDRRTLDNTFSLTCVRCVN